MFQNCYQCDNRLAEIKEATQEDIITSALLTLCKNGWPPYKQDIPDCVKYYWNMKCEIHSEDGIYYFSVIICLCLKNLPFILNCLHETYLGMDKCKTKARTLFYWPKMSDDIEKIISSCAICAKLKRNNQRKSLIPHAVPKRPWSKIGADIFTVGGKDYIVIVDYFSKFPEVLILNSKTAKEVIEILKSIFSRHGIPDVFMSDNMPFASFEMKQFADD
jgi:hypothetical protein